MDSIKIKAYAKINLSLDITGKRDNGYHDVEMIMQQITLCDNVEIIKKDKDITIETNSKFVPDDDRNIGVKVAKEILEKYNIKSGIHIKINKKIPVAAGLAGGSADAAAVIKGLNDLFELNMTVDEMKDIGVIHGADIPFCIEGGASVARGIGEELEPIKGLKDVYIVLCKPSISVSTAKVYNRFDINNVKKHPDTKLLLDAIENGDFRTVAINMYNVLEEVTSKRYMVISELEKKMSEYGAIGTMMSGSGPTVFGIFNNYKRAESAYKNLKKRNKQVFLTKTYNEKII